MEEVFDSLNCSDWKIISIILKLCPVYYVKWVDSIEYLLNIHQTIAGCCKIDNLFEANNEGKWKEPEPLKRKKKERKSTFLEMRKRSVGQRSIVSKFPTIPDVETEFLNINGFRAQEKRCDDFQACGISVVDVRLHLLENIPGLKQHGIPKSSIHYLFGPVNIWHISARR